MIPDAAVEALARVLASDELFRADCDGYGWDAETDSSDHFMPNARKNARRYLEAAAPHIAAQAWDEGSDAGSDNQAAWDGWRYSKGYPITNPYREATR